VESHQRESGRRGGRRSTRAGSRCYRPTLLALEGRALLSTFTVESIADDGSVGTLRWAIGQANVSSEADTIAFSSLFNTPQTIKLTSGSLVLTDGATTTINGPGANLLTVSGNTAVRARVFDVTGAVTIAGLKISGGSAESGSGGGIRNVGGTVSLTDCTISGNTATGTGGGVYNDGNLSMTGCTLTGNTATGTGGGLNCTQNGGTLTNCTITGNSANKGGGVYNSTTTLLLTNCTVSGNTANQGGGLFAYDAITELTGCTVSGNTGADSGGGLYTGTGGITTATDCTVSGNTAANNGGGLVNGYMATTTLISATVSGNTAKDGGGLYVSATRGGTTTLTNTIVAGQVAGGDITGAVNPASANNLVGSGAGMTGISNGSGDNQVGSAQAPIDPQLAPLDGYGGPTLTMALLSGSRAIGKGAAGTGVPATDQRGFARGASVDIGAFQSQDTALLMVAVTTDGVGAGPGQFSLRQAVNLANIQPDITTISFDPSVFGATPRTIKLTGELDLMHPGTTTITGPGATLLTIRGNQRSRVFDIERGSVALSGLTISGGNGDFGGGLKNEGTLTLTNCTISGNVADGGGGLGNSYGTLTLINCTVTNNSTNFSGGGLDNAGGTLTLINCTVSGNAAGNSGGGLDNFNGTATLTNCTVSGNSAGYGGGLYNADTLTLTNCTVTGNSAKFLGGGLDNNAGALTAINTIVSENRNGDIAGNYSGSNNLIGGSPMLAPLGPYGGPTLTMPLLPGSPAIGGGTTGAGIPTTDQRGQPRSSHVDIGAFQSQGFILTPVPGSTPQLAAAGSAFADPLAVLVKAINSVEPVDGGVIGFAAPSSGASATLSATTSAIAGGQAGVTATANTTLGAYTVTAMTAGTAMGAGFALTNTDSPPNVVARPVAAVAGRAFNNVVVATFTDSDSSASPSNFVAAIVWGDGITTSSTTVVADGPSRFDILGTHTYVDAGSYAFRVQVTDSTGANATATSTATVTARASTEAPSLVLTTRRDVVDAHDGLTSLREAVAYANSHPGPDTIVLDPSVLGSGRSTIRLAGGPLVLTDPATTTIVGPGARRLTISGAGRSRVFDVRGGSLALSGLTITGGRADNGGGIRNDGGRLVLTGVIIRGNKARVGPGLFNTRAATFTWRRSPVGGRV
jgi:hypothetical protein